MTLTTTILFSILVQGSEVLHADDLAFLASLPTRSQRGGEFSTYLTQRHLQPVPESGLGQEALAHSKKWMAQTLAPDLLKDAQKAPWSGRLAPELNYNWRIFTRTWRSGLDRVEWVDTGQVAVLYIGHGEERILTSREEAQRYAQEILQRYFKVQGDYSSDETSLIHESIQLGKPACYSGYARLPRSVSAGRPLTWKNAFYFATDGSHSVIRMNFYDDSLEVRDRVCDPANRFSDP